MNLIIKQLPENYQYFVLARQEPQMKNLRPNEVKSGIAKILSQASFDMGSPMSADKEILTFQTEACFKELTFKYSTLTLSELRNAFTMGIRNEFGQYFGMCPKTYHQFIKAYYELPDRFKAQEAYLKLGNASEGGIEDKSLPPNPEGQKKVVDILKQYVVKPIDYTKKPLEEKIKKPIVKSERDTFIHNCINEHYKIWLKKPYKDPPRKPSKVEGLIDTGETGGRYIEFDGKPVTELEYVHIKLKEYDLTNTTSTS